MPNLELVRKDDVSSFRKVAIGTWRTAYDPSVYGTMELRMDEAMRDRKSTRLNSSHVAISYAVFCLIRRPPTATLFPYTTLFRSQMKQHGAFYHFCTRYTAAHAQPRARTQRRRVQLPQGRHRHLAHRLRPVGVRHDGAAHGRGDARSEEHTSELQSRGHLVCRLLLDTPTSDSYTLSLHDALPISNETARRVLSLLHAIYCRACPTSSSYAKTTCPASARSPSAPGAPPTTRRCTARWSCAWTRRCEIGRAHV